MTTIQVLYKFLVRKLITNISFFHNHNNMHTVQCTYVTFLFKCEHTTPIRRLGETELGNLHVHPHDFDLFN